jgi:hypothetical protein
MTIPEEKRAGYISLKEASERFGYSQDYIGQLIRKGKIEGKLVYSHVAWVTTPEAVEAYIARGKEKKKKKKGGDEEEGEMQATNGANEFSPLATQSPPIDSDANAHRVMEVEHVSYEDSPSRLAGWLIILFRVLLFVVIVVAVFVFYLLTTAFGEEVRESGVMSSSTSFSLSVDSFNHE